VASLALLLLLLLLFGSWRLSRSRSVQLFGDMVTRVETEERVVAITLDDGPHPARTFEVLEMLDELEVRATFFVTGHELERAPEAGRAIVERGHELGNHSWSHQRMVLRSPRWVRREVEATDSLIRAAGHRGEIFFRAPYGMRLVVLPWYLARTGRTTVLWDVEPETDPAVAATAEGIVAHVVERVRPGSIVLLHVMYESRATSREALPALVWELRARGYRFVTLGEIMRMSS
jgi:peptidoglycan-N-acetylglucosamine deacetylase